MAYVTHLRSKHHLHTSTCPLALPFWKYSTPSDVSDKATGVHVVHWFLLPVLIDFLAIDLATR